MTARTTSLPQPAAALPLQADFPVMKIVLWSVLFQIAWFWEKIPLLLSEGAMPDTDDFQRLSQVRNWMGGQGWFDLFNHRMNPPVGADIHWSRLVDLPIAALTLLFDLVFEAELAQRLAALVWPMALLVATVLVIIAVCRALERRANPLLALLFTVTCITALTEFMPGRIDHHGVQILFFCLMLLGVVLGKAGWGPFLFGASVAASISVGLDAIMIIAFLIAWFGLDWVIGRDPQGRGLKGVATGLVCVAPVLYLANFPPSAWALARCDANSAFYFLALLLVSLAFASLGFGSARLSAAGNPARTMMLRLVAGALAGALALGVLLLVYPQCAAGPFSQLPLDLKTRWLVNVGEARGLFAQLKTVPQLWFWGVFYSGFLVAAAAVVTLRRYRQSPQIIALFATLCISVIASTVQYRALRIGIFAAIPFCVLFAEMAFAAIQQRFAMPVLRGILQTAIVCLLASPTWLAMGALVIPPKAEPAVPAVDTAQTSGSASGWRARGPHVFCNRQSEYAELARLPPGLVMSDIDSGPAILVFTRHSAVGGPYHRNDRAILDIIDFFETDIGKARSVAIARGIAYVAYCEDVAPLEARLNDNPALAVKIRQGMEPDWLERVSTPGSRMHVFKVRLPKA